MKTTMYSCIMSLVVLTFVTLTSAGTQLVEVPDHCYEKIKQSIDQCTCEVGKKWLSEDCTTQFRCTKRNQVKERNYTCRSGKKCKISGGKGKCVKDPIAGYIHHPGKDCNRYNDDDIELKQNVSLKECLKACTDNLYCVVVQYNGMQDCILKYFCDTLRNDSASANIYEKEVPYVRYIHHVSKDCPGNDILTRTGVYLRFCLMSCTDNPTCAAVQYSNVGNVDVYIYNCYLKSACGTLVPVVTDGVTSANIYKKESAG